MRTGGENGRVNVESSRRSLIILGVSGTNRIAGEYPGFHAQSKLHRNLVLGRRQFDRRVVTLVRVAGSAFVADCGVRYSGSSPLPDLSMLADTRVDAILLTHARVRRRYGARRL
jgi:predicted metal-dependent RNase